MKKYLILIIFTYLLPIYSFSQEYKYLPFPDSGVIWSEIYQFAGEELPGYCYERFALSGEDTVINEFTYKKLYIFYDTIFKKDNAIYVGGIREDSLKRIYFKGDSAIHFLKPSYTKIINNGGQEGDEMLLYDFSLNVGDTSQTDNVSLGYEILIVSDIDTILIGNTLRKKYSFEDLFWVKWIEGIGSVKGLLFTSGDLPISNLDNDLICFRQNDTILYFNDAYDDCMPVITGIATKKYMPVIRVFPNPVTGGKLLMDFGNRNIKYLEIYDSMGRMLNRIAVKGQTCTVYLNGEYPSGIYFFSAMNQKDMKFSGKFVVQ